MGAELIVRLSDGVRETLESQAQLRGIGIATRIGELAAKEARDAWCARIRAQSEAVGARVSASAEAKALYEDWGRPGWESLDQGGE